MGWFLGCDNKKDTKSFRKGRSYGYKRGGLEDLGMHLREAPPWRNSPLDRDLLHAQHLA